MVGHYIYINIYILLGFLENRQAQIIISYLLFSNIRFFKLIYVFLENIINLINDIKFINYLYYYF